MQELAGRVGMLLLLLLKGLSQTDEVGQEVHPLLFVTTFFCC